MRFTTPAGICVLLLSLAGCAGTPTVLNQSRQKTLRALQLFDARDKPRFTFYLACTSHDASCVNAERAFDRWANDRRVDLHEVDPTDVAFQVAAPAASQSTALPYRIAVRYAPIVIPGVNVHDAGATNYTPPKVSYSATIKVFDTASGKLLQDIPASHQQTTTLEGDAGDYIRAEVRRFIATIDPDY